MAIAASTVLPTNSLEDFRIEFNNLVSDVSGITCLLYTSDAADE